jgi:gamma-glutamyl-gamma-aminobutyrate hydrolase PuuD
MATVRPLIGITPDAVTMESADRRGSYCSTAYTRAVEAAGGVAVILPLTREPVVLEVYLKSCHGLLLTGGGDVSARYYRGGLSEAERATIARADEVRDEMEIYLVREALDTGRPLLGVCRGMQLLNLAADGSLIADIGLRRPDALPHRHPQADAFAHAVDWEEGRQLTQILGRGCESVNSTHHQAVDMVAPGFEVAARAPDGIIEAIEKPDARFVCGVQFHPERLLEKAPQFLRLFEALVERAAPR